MFLQPFRKKIVLAIPAIIVPPTVIAIKVTVSAIATGTVAAAVFSGHSDDILWLLLLIILLLFILAVELLELLAVELEELLPVELDEILLKITVPVLLLEELEEELEDKNPI